MSKDLELILNSVRNRRSIQYMKGLFKTVNQLYRERIDRVQDNASLSEEEDSPQEDRRRSISPTITLAQLKESLPAGESVITELDMLAGVLEKVKHEVALDESDTAGLSGSAPIEAYRYLLTVTIAYANSLLSYLIYPHKRLQIFMVDLCKASRNFVTLQQLINFHVVLDSSELLEQLTHMESLFPGERWIPQTRLDIAKRLRQTETVIDCLVKQNRENEIIEYIRKHDCEYRIEKLFDSLRNVAAANKKKLWQQVELWNIAPTEEPRPVLSHRIVVLMSR